MLKCVVFQADLYVTVIYFYQRIMYGYKIKVQLHHKEDKNA